MDGESSNRIFLKTGDLIVLQSETDDGYCSVSLEDYRGIMSPAKSHGSVFKIFPLTYQKKKQEQTPIPSTPSATPSLGVNGVSADDAVAGESVALHRQLEGRAVVYGQVIQLQHITTSRFLAAKVSAPKSSWGGPPNLFNMGKNVNNEGEEHEGAQSTLAGMFGAGGAENRMMGGGLSGQVMLSKGSRKRCWFRIMPRFKGQGRGEGDKIYVDENICLVHVKSGQFVVSGMASEYGDLTASVGLSISLAGWKLELYSIIGDGFVRPGDALRFFHEEGGYLSRAGSVDGKGGVYLLGHGPRALYTYGTIWQVEPEDEGGLVGYSMPVRIRLLHHDLFLSLTENNPHQEHLPVSASTTDLPKVAAAAAQSRENMWMTLSEIPSTDTLFVLHAVRSYQSSEAGHTQIPYGHYIRIQHARTRRWVHCVDMFKQSPSHMMVGWKYREVVASRAFDHNNIFLVQPIPQGHVDASFYVRVRMPVLQDFLKSLSSHGADQQAQTENAEKVLGELVKFCTKTPNPDPIPENQALLIAQDPLQLYISILKALPKPTHPTPLVSTSTPRSVPRHKEKDTSDPWMRVRKTIFLLFRQICKMNNKNSRTLAVHLDVMTPWLGYPEMNVVATLQEMFKDNSLLLDTQYATTALQAALDLLRTTPTISSSMRALNGPPPAIVYTHDPRILDFLATLCSSNDKAVPHNQNDIAAAIFAPPLGPPISTRIGPATASIEALVPPQPQDVSETGTWVDVAKLAAHSTGGGGVKGMFSAATVPLHYTQCSQWVTAQLNLAAMVCLGQNYRSIHLVEGCHSWKEAFKALVQPNIPFDIRTAYCKVVLHVFVDRFPQHHIAGSMTVAPLSDIQSFQTTAASEQPQAKDTHVPKKIKGGTMPTSASTGSVYDSTKESGGASLNAPYTPKNLQEFLIFFVQEESHLPENAAKTPAYSSDQLNFFRTVLILLRHSVSFGFFKLPVLESSFLSRFSAILQIPLPTGGAIVRSASAAKRSNSELPVKQVAAKDNKRKFFTRQTSFYMKSETNDKPKLLLEVKMEVLRIIDTYLSMHAKDQFISFVLAYLQDRKATPIHSVPMLKSPTDSRIALLSKDTASEASSSSTPPSPAPGAVERVRRGTIYSRTNTQEENALREQLKHRLKEAQTLFTYQGSWYSLQQTLGSTMGALLWHPSPELVCNSMNILVRIQRNRSGVNSDIHLAIQSVMILVSEGLVKSYQHILSNVHRLRELLSHYHTTAYLASSANNNNANSSSSSNVSPLPQLTNILDTFRTMCLNSNLEGDDTVRVAPELQRVLRNVNAHEHTMRVLALVQEDAISSLTSLSTSTETSESALAFEAAISFLRIFCYRNPQNQNALYPHVDFLIGLMLRTKNYSNCADCIAEIFRDNYSLCTRVKARHAEAFVSLIVKNGKDFKFLSFFKVIPVASGIPIKANQLLVLRMLASNAANTMPQIPYRGTIANSSEILYHAALLDILGLCSYGMNHSAEAYCQSLVSVGQCLRIIGDTNTPFSVRAAYCRFLDEVYLNTEAPITSVVLLHQNDRFWTLLSETFSQVLEHFLSVVSSSSRPKPFSRLRTDSLKAPHNKNVLRPKQRIHSGGLTLNNVEVVAFSSASAGKGKQKEDEVRTDLDLRDFVFSSIIPLVSNFCARHFTISESTKENHIGIIVHLYEQFRALEGFVVGPARAAIASCLRDIQTTGITPPHFRRLSAIDGKNDDDEEPSGADPPVQSSLDLLDLSEINLAKLYFPLVHSLPLESASAGSTTSELLLDVILGFIKLASGGGRGKELAIGASRGAGWAGLNPHSENTAQLGLHMLNMTSSLLAVHGNTDWEQVTQLGTLEGMLSVLSLVRVHSYPILNPPLVLRGLKVLVAVLETAPEARATAAQLVFSRTDDDMNLCELLVSLIGSAVDALGSIGRAHASRDVTGEPSEQPLLVVSESVGEDPYHKYLNVLYVIFQLVESVCRGESNALKTYLRHQGDHLRSYDVLKGTVQALRQLEQLVLGRSVNMPFGLTVLAQCCRTIRATVTGVPTNQAAIVDMRVVVNTCNRMLLFAFEAKDAAEAGPAFELMLQILDLIFSLIEGNPDPSPIIISLDFKVLETITSLLARDTDSEEVRAQLEKLASMALRVVKVLAEVDNQKGHATVMQSLNVMEEHCKLRIGRIEFVRETKLERLYFPIPALCRGTDETLLQIDLEDKLSQQVVSWNNPASKLELFIEWVGDISRKLTLSYQGHTDSTKNWSFLRPSSWPTLMMKWAQVWMNATLFLSFVISVFILAVMNKDGKFPNHVDTVVIILSCLHVVASTLQVINYYRQEGPLLHFRYWKKYLPQSGLLLSGSLMVLEFRLFFRQLGNILYARGVPVTKYYVNSIFNFLTHPNSVFHLAYFVCSVLGLAISPLFYAFHLFQVVFRSRHLRIVLRAVSSNASKLLLMGLFMLCVLFIFAIVNWRFFAVLFSSADDGTYCETVLMCLLSNLYFGLAKTGEIVEKMNPYDWNSATEQVGMLFNFLFFIAFGVIMLNLVFAVIVDSFGELRDSRAEAQREKFRRCFICSIEREIFQRRSIDFYRHIKDDHSPWHWLYFFIHLQTKLRKDFTSHEEYIYRKIESGDYLSFFPVDRAVCLEADEAKENKMDFMGFPQNAANANAALGRRIVALETRISQLIGQLEHQQITSSQLQMQHPLPRAQSVHSPKASSLNLNSLNVMIPSSPTAESASNLVDPSTGDFPFTMTRPRRLTKGSVGGDRSPSPPRSASSSSTNLTHRLTMTQKKKQKQRENAELLLSTPAYRGSALSLSDMVHSSPSSSPTPPPHDDFDEL